MSSDGDEPSFTVPSFRRADRFAIAKPGELGGIEGVRGAEQSQERLITMCQSCSAILVVQRGFVVCTMCRAIVHASRPCAVMVDRRATCGGCVLRMFPYQREAFLLVGSKIMKPKKFDLAKELGTDRQWLKEIEASMNAAGLLNKGRLTGYGLRAFYYLYQIFSYEPEVALLILKMEMAMDV